jgi:hypothetical protein
MTLLEAEKTLKNESKISDQLKNELTTEKWLKNNWKMSQLLKFDWIFAEKWLKKNR